MEKFIFPESKVSINNFWLKTWKLVPTAESRNSNVVTAFDWNSTDKGSPFQLMRKPPIRLKAAAVKLFKPNLSLKKRTEASIRKIV